MGFNLNKAKAAKEEILRSFIPLELNEGNVQAIFNRCLAKENSTRKVTSVLYQVNEGFGVEDMNTVYFDLAIFTQNFRNIAYLYGQLKAVHMHGNENTNIRPINEMLEKYDGTFWDDVKGRNKPFGNVEKLLHLGSPPNFFMKTIWIPNSNALFQTHVCLHADKPTLSPKDPDFPTWWEAHKAEWEQ